jgi:uncharacterized lipoprotein YmbA
VSLKLVWMLRGYDKNQIVVVRTAANRVDILETHCLAESPKSEIPRIIAADLGILLKPARVSTYPQNAGLEADYRVLLDIQRFEMTAGEGVGLEALWSVRRSDGGVPKTGRTVVSEPVSAAGYDALVRPRVGHWLPSAAIWPRRCAKWRGPRSRNEPNELCHIVAASSRLTVEG